MSLMGALASELPFLRAEAEALMVDEFEMRSYGDGYVYDPVADEDRREFTLLYSTPGRILTSTAAGEVQVGGRTSTRISRTLHVPAAEDTVPVGTVAHRVADGAQFEVVADVTHPQPKSRRFQVNEVLS